MLAFQLNIPEIFSEVLASPAYMVATPMYMIPIPIKLQIFPYTCLFTFLKT